MTGRHRLGGGLTALNLLLSAVSVAIVVAGFALHLRFGRGRAGGDWTLARLLWSYVAATPLLTAAGLILGDRTTRLIRTNYLLLGVWIFAVLWSATMTL